MANKKKNTSPKSAQSLTFTLVIYPEWSYFNNILAHLLKFKYALILHDKDEFEDGTLKQPHCHVVVKYGGYRTLSSVKNEFKTLQVEERFVDTCNERAMLRYLIHKDNPEKYQYSIKDIKTNMIEDVELAMKEIISSDSAFYHINKYIDESKTYISQSNLNKYCIDNGLLKGLKAYQSQINNARNEHNKTLDTLNDIDNRLERERVSMEVTRDKEITKIFDTALVSGFDEVVIGGERYQIVRLKSKE